MVDPYLFKEAFEGTYDTWLQWGAKVGSKKQARQHLARGEEFVKQQPYAEAEVEFGAARRLDPHSPRAFFRLGTMLANRGDWYGAMEEFEEALRLDPGNGAVRDAYDEAAREASRSRFRSSGFWR